MFGVSSSPTLAVSITETNNLQIHEFYVETAILNTQDIST